MPTIATQTENILDMKRILDHFTREQIVGYLMEQYTEPLPTQIPELNVYQDDEKLTLPLALEDCLADIASSLIKIAEEAKESPQKQPSLVEIQRLRDRVRAEAKAAGKKQEAVKVAKAAAEAAKAAASYEPPQPQPHVQVTPEQEVTGLYGRIEDVKRELARVQKLADDTATNRYIIKKVFERVPPNLKREWKTRIQNLVSDIRKYHASQLTLQNHAPSYNLPTRWVERLEQNVAALHKESLRQKKLFIDDQKLIADIEAKMLKEQQEAAEGNVMEEEKEEAEAPPAPAPAPMPAPKSPPPASDAQTTIMIQLANQTFENPLQPPAHIVGSRIPDVCKVFEHGVKQDGTEYMKGITKKRLTELQSMASIKKHKVERVHYYVHPRCKQTSTGVQIVAEAGSYALGRRLFVAWFPCEVNSDRTRVKLHIRDVCVPPTKYTGKDVRIDLSRKDKRQRVFELLQAMEAHVHCPIIE